MRTTSRGRRGIHALHARIEYLYNEADALEDEAREKREEAEKLEKELEKAEERRQNWPAEPAEIRCFCGEPLVAYRPPALGGQEAVGRRPAAPVFSLLRPYGCRVDACPACRADLEFVLEELAINPARGIPPEQLALPVEGACGP